MLCAFTVSQEICAVFRGNCQYFSVPESSARVRDGEIGTKEHKICTYLPGQIEIAVWKSQLLTHRIAAVWRSCCPFPSIVLEKMWMTTPYACTETRPKVNITSTDLAAETISKVLIT